MRNISIAFGILLAFVFQNVSYAQYNVQRKIYKPVILSMLEYRSWKTELSKITQTASQISTPMMFSLPINSITLDIAGSTVFSSDSKDNMSGLSDVKIRAIAMFMDDTLLLTAGVSLPNGRSELKENEIVLSSFLSNEAMGFRYNRLGEGLNINFGCGTVKTRGVLNLGIGAGCLIKGKYRYLKDIASEYDPGDQINLTAGFDTLFETIFLRGSMTYVIYGKDKIDAQDVFSEGNKLLIESASGVSIWRLTAIIKGSYINRANSDFVNAGEKEEHGSQFNINGTANLKLTNMFGFNILTENVLIGKKDEGSEDSSVFGFGALI